MVLSRSAIRKKHKKRGHSGHAVSLETRTHGPFPMRLPACPSRPSPSTQTEFFSCREEEARATFGFQAICNFRRFRMVLFVMSLAATVRFARMDLRVLL